MISENPDNAVLEHLHASMSVVSLIRGVSLLTNVPVEGLDISHTLCKI